MSDAAIINNRLQKTDEGDFASIAAQANTFSTDEVDRLDAHTRVGADPVPKAREHPPTASSRRILAVP